MIVYTSFQIFIACSPFLKQSSHILALIICGIQVIHVDDLSKILFSHCKCMFCFNAKKHFSCNTVFSFYPCSPSWVRHLKQSNRTEFINISECHPRGVQRTDQVHPSEKFNGPISYTTVFKVVIAVSFQWTIFQIFILSSICFFEYAPWIWTQFTDLWKEISSEVNISLNIYKVQRFGMFTWFSTL